MRVSTNVLETIYNFSLQFYERLDRNLVNLLKSFSIEILEILSLKFFY